MLLKEAIAYAKAVRQTKLACACGSSSNAFEPPSLVNEDEIDDLIRGLEIEANDRIPTHNAFEQSTTGSVCSV